MTTTRAASSRVSRRSRVVLLCAATTVASTVALTSCGSSAPDPTGVWAASDGSATKTIRSDGSCTGMYYNQGKPLDIGGGMTCTLSSQKASDGTYTMVVSQPPNQTTYRVVFTGKNVMAVKDTSGALIVTLTRQ